MTRENFSEDLELLHSEQFKQECLKKFIEYRNDYIEDLPAERLMPLDKNYYRYKCRGNFFAGIKYDIWNLLNKGIITNPDAIQKGNEYLDYVTNRDFTKFSTKEDIDKVNEILDIMIKELS